MKTIAEIRELKRNWRNDPCWDIEQTEGFEAHHDELRAYRLECEAEYRTAEQHRLDARAAELGISGNITLTRHIERLELQIKRVSELLERAV